MEASSVISVKLFHLISVISGSFTVELPPLSPSPTSFNVTAWAHLLCIHSILFIINIFAWECWIFFKKKI